MTEYRLSPLAEQDIETILEWTHEEFGEKARIRYEALLTRAVMDVTEAPERMGSHDRPEIAAAARTYHLQVVATVSRNPLGGCSGLGISSCTGQLTTAKSRSGGSSHDGMDLTRHLPGEYRAADW